MKNSPKSFIESRQLPKTLGRGVDHSLKAEVAILRSDDFAGITRFAIDRLGEAQLSANMRHSLLGYFVRIAHLEINGEPTTHASIAQRSEATLNTVVSALTKLTDLKLLEKTKSCLPTNGLIVSYRVSKRLIVKSRGAASPRSS